jgi:hypothetical protein
VRLIVSATQSLNILSICWRDSTYAIRTWTPDLTILSLNASAGILWLSLCLGQRHGSFRASRETTPVATFSPDLSVLSVQGLHIATINKSFATKRRTPDVSVFTYKAVLQNMFKIWDEISESPEADRKLLWTAWIGGAACEFGPEDYERWTSWIGNIDDISGENKAQCLDFWHEFLAREYNRDLFLTNEEHIGKGWKTVQEGDFICIIFGCDVPLVLRLVEDYYELIGDCYIEQFMRGDAMKDFENGRMEVSTFNLH